MTANGRDRQVVVCELVMDSPVAPVPSIQDRCTDCRRHVWIDRAMVDRYRSMELEPVCLRCAAVAYADDPDGGEMLYLPEQLPLVEGLFGTTEHATNETRRWMAEELDRMRKGQ